MQFLSHFWWLIFVFGGTIGGALKAIGAANERRLERRQERYRLKQQAKIAVVQAKAQDQVDELTQRREIDKTIVEHDQTDAKWFAYEIDPITLLDFPMMTDMREPLTVEFHKAKRRADLLRPRRRRRWWETGGPRRSIARPCTPTSSRSTSPKRRRNADAAAGSPTTSKNTSCVPRVCYGWRWTRAPRRRSARALTGRRSKELEGLILLPSSMRAQIERHIAGQIEA